MSSHMSVVGVFLLASAVAAAAQAPPVAPGGAHVAGALQAALQDVYHARAVYERVIADHGAVRPFVNVVRAEQRHIEALVRMFDVYGIAAPEPAWTPAAAPAFATVAEACDAAVDAERENVALYDRILTPDLPANMQQVFMRLRDASRLRHLPAFERCGGGPGQGPAKAVRPGRGRAGRR